MKYLLDVMKDVSHSDYEPKNFIIVFYPGKDECNENSTNKKSDYRRKYNALEWKTNMYVYYFYRDDEGLFDKFYGGKNWCKDYEHKIEKIFFKYKYPCYSTVIVKENGRFYAFLGEHNWSEVSSLYKQIQKTSGI